MNGHIFETHSGQSNRGQFQDSLDTLKFYAFTKFKQDISLLSPLFSQLKVKTVHKPGEPAELFEIDEGGKLIEDISNQFVKTVTNFEKLFPRKT